MPIPELIKFRQKYPQYDDIDDATIANRLSEKYPDSYGDLPSKVNSVSQESETKESFGRKAYREVVSPIVSGSSTLALGIPREVARKTGTEELIYPEQKTIPGKILRGASEAVGLLGGGAARGTKLALKGAQRIIPKLGGKGLLARSARGAMAGGTFGLLQAPFEKDKSRLQQSKEYAGYGAAIPVMGTGLKKIGTFITKSGRWVARNIGGVSDATVDIIKRLGAERVFEPAKAKIDYIGKVIVPKAQKRIVDTITSPNLKSKHILKELGMKTDEIEILNKVDKNTLKKLQGLFGEDWNAMQKGLQQIKGNADMQFKSVLGKQPANKMIDVKDTYYRLKNLLYKEGWIDLQGNERIGAGITNKTKSNLIKIFNDLKGGLVTEGKTRVTGQIGIKEYFNKLNELEASLGEQPKFDRLVYQIQKSLRNEATKSIPGLAKANKAYADAINLSELENAFTKLDNTLKLEAKLLQLKNVAKTQLHKQYKTILGNDLYDDLLSHLANQDFELVSDLPKPQGGFYPSRAGFLRGAISGGAKQYYKRILPETQKLKGVMGETGKKITGLLGR